jgi:hypothetical protein
MNVEYHSARLAAGLLLATAGVLALTMKPMAGHAGHAMGA